MNGSCDRMRLDRLTSFPERLADIGPREIRRVMPNPTLISIAGRAGAGGAGAPLFVSTMLHGNETTSFFVLQALARRFAHEAPHRPLIIFVGGVHAAEAGLRIAPGGVDFNRVWAGGEGEEAAIAAQVVETLKVAQPFASIDIHNTTGANPCYGCIARLDAAHLGLASLFSRIIVQYENPPTTQSVVFSQFCTAATIECGRAGDQTGIARATDFVLDALRVEALAALQPKPGDVEIFKTAGRVELVDGVSLSFGGTADIVFEEDFDRLNFTELAPGEVFARISSEGDGVRVYDEARRDLTDQFFIRDGRYLRLVRAATPAMLTTQPDIVRQDCVGYLMERVEGVPGKD